MTAPSPAATHVAALTVSEPAASDRPQPASASVAALAGSQARGK